MSDLLDTKSSRFERLRKSIETARAESTFQPDRVKMLRKFWEQADGPENDRAVAEMLDRPRTLSPKSRATQIN